MLQGLWVLTVQSKRVRTHIWLSLVEVGVPPSVRSRHCLSVIAKRFGRFLSVQVLVWLAMLVPGVLPELVEGVTRKLFITAVDCDE